jgi:hypothetical protein
MPKSDDFHFTSWFQGFLAAAITPPTARQWAMIIENFDKLELPERTGIWLNGFCQALTVRPSADQWRVVRAAFLEHLELPTDILGKGRKTRDSDEGDGDSDE